ncbi:centromere protein P isoform X1 [Paroedura picta]|uniref:centromere protein P isoform X1 n=1 Tax=Paroedura picta TaxID=143630 RepID=UPI004057C156
MNINTLQVYEDEIQSLEKEIKMLTEKYECKQRGSFTYSKRRTKKAMKAVKRKFQDPKQYYSSPDLKTQLALLESDFSFLMNFTGIWFKNYSLRLLEKSEIKTAYKCRILGNCQSVIFQLEFRLTEENQSNRNGYAVVTDLSIIIECEESSDLNKIVSRAEENGNLLLFFKSLSCFCEGHDYRKRTLAHFKETWGHQAGEPLCIRHGQQSGNPSCLCNGKGSEMTSPYWTFMDSLSCDEDKYPNIVALPEGVSGDCMILKNTELPGFELMIVWKIHVDKDGKVTPVLDFLSKIPMAVLGNKAFASDMPRWFRSLLQVLGIEASIEAMIKSLCRGK